MYTAKVTIINSPDQYSGGSHHLGSCIRSTTAFRNYCVRSVNHKLTSSPGSSLLFKMAGEVAGEKTGLLLTSRHFQIIKERTLGTRLKNDVPFSSFFLALQQRLSRLLFVQRYYFDCLLSSLLRSYLPILFCTEVF